MDLYGKRKNPVSKNEKIILMRASDNWVYAFKLLILHYSMIIAYELSPRPSWLTTCARLYPIEGLLDKRVFSNLSLSKVYLIEG